jgi:hypothetical protein
VRGIPPPLRSRGADVSRTPSSRQSAHSLRTKHIEDSQRPVDQREHEKHRKELEQYHAVILMSSRGPV